MARRIAKIVTVLTAVLTALTGMSAPALGGNPQRLVEPDRLQRRAEPGESL
jgi:hypothetical protein